MIRQLISVVLFSILTSAAFGRDDAGKTYRCTAKDAVSLEDNGALDKNPLADARRKYFDGMVIDLIGGDVTYPSGGQREKRAVQVADVVAEADAKDYVLIPETALRRKKAVAKASTDFIRLRVQTREPQVTFAAFSLSQLVTGTCELAR
ncbi:MAG TPA: hypothetical protein VI358_15160 [Pseudolabrys sp.]